MGIRTSCPSPGIRTLRYLRIGSRTLTNCTNPTRLWVAPTQANKRQPRACSRPGRGHVMGPARAARTGLLSPTDPFARRSKMAGPRELAFQAKVRESESRRGQTRGSADADIIYANAPDPLFGSRL